MCIRVHAIVCWVVGHIKNVRIKKTKVVALHSSFPDQFELCSTVLPLSTGCTDVFTMRFQFYFNSILEPGGIHWILVPFCWTPLDSTGFCQNDQSLTGIEGTVKCLQRLLGVMFPVFWWNKPEMHCREWSVTISLL